MRIALLQLALDDALEPARRREEVAAAVREAVGGRDSAGSSGSTDAGSTDHAGSTDLVVLPELWPAGAFAAGRWSERAEALHGPTYEMLAALATQLRCVIHGGSIIERDGEKLYNTALVVGPDGGLLASYRKIHRFGAGGREKELLAAGTQPCVVDLPLPDGGCVTTGLATCYDLRFPELFRLLSRRGAELVLMPGAWPASREADWPPLFRARAIENQVFLVTCGVAGETGRTPMSGGTAVVHPSGKVLHWAGAEPTLVTMDLDLGEVSAFRESFPVLQDRCLDRC